MGLTFSAPIIKFAVTNAMQGASVAISPLTDSLTAVSGEACSESQKAIAGKDQTEQDCNHVGFRGLVFLKATQQYETTGIDNDISQQERVSKKCSASHRF